jgi:hypothetical protein
VIFYKCKKDINIYGIQKKEFGAILAYANGESAGMIQFMKKEDRIKLYAHARKYKVDFQYGSSVFNNVKYVVYIIEVLF